MSQELQTNPEDARQYAERIVAESNQALATATEILGLTVENGDYAAVLPETPEVRAEADDVQMSSEQEKALRETVAVLGVGRESDQTLAENSLSGGHVIIEGGQLHKIIAESQVAVADSAQAPASIIFAASAERAIKDTEKVAEKTTAQKTLSLHYGRDVSIDEVGGNEYELAIQAAKLIPGFEADEPAEIGCSYDKETYEVNAESSDQFINIGHVGNTPVMIMRIDRSYYEDDEGKTKYRQPKTADVVKIIDAVVRTHNPENDAPIALVTSGTYRPSRQVDVARASLETGRVAGVAAYGTHRLADVKGDDLPQPTDLNQIPGELGKAARSVAKLEAYLAEQQ
jgi:hypothetical protein